MRILSAFNAMGIRKRFMWASAFGVTSTVIISLLIMLLLPAEEEVIFIGAEGPQAGKGILEVGVHVTWQFA